MEDGRKENDVFLELASLGNELDELSLFLLNKIEKEGRFNYKSNIQWGGIIGAIQDSREDKKRIHFLNEPMYKGMSFAKLAFYIMDKTDKIVEKALVIQENTPKDDIKYHGVAKLAFDFITNAAGAWHNYAPEASEELVNIGDQKDVGLWYSVKSEVEEQLLRLDLPDNLREQLLLEKKSDNKSGCLGLFVAITVSITSMVWLIIL